MITKDFLFCKIYRKGDLYIMRINSIREIRKGQVWEDGTSIYLIKNIKYQNSCPIYAGCYIYDLEGNYLIQNEISATCFYFSNESGMRLSGLIEDERSNRRALFTGGGERIDFFIKESETADPRYYYSKSKFSGLNLIEKLKYHYEKPNFLDGDIILVNPGFFFGYDGEPIKGLILQPRTPNDLIPVYIDNYGVFEYSTDELRRNCKIIGRIGETHELGLMK